MHICDRIRHYCIPFFRDLPDDGHVKVEKCKRHIFR